MTIKTTEDQVAALMSLPQDEPVVMVNLLKFKEGDGAASYQRYAEEAVPHLARVGASVVYGGATPAVILGDGAKPWWDAILLVRYPTPAPSSRWWQIRRTTRCTSIGRPRSTVATSSPRRPGRWPRRSTESAARVPVFGWATTEPAFAGPGQHTLLGIAEFARQV